MKVASIVEGDGEVEALPILLRRIAQWLTPESHCEILLPIRVRRDKFLNREEELRRYTLLANGKCGENGWVLILLDADDDCPATLAKTTHERVGKYVHLSKISVVLANREYESWFIAAAESLHGRRGFVYNPIDNIDPEIPRNAKRWIAERMAGRGYGEKLDQPAFSQLLDLEQASNRSRSFRKLCSEWRAQIKRHTTA